MHESCRQPSWPEWPLKTISVTDHHRIHFSGSFPVRCDLMWWCPSRETQLRSGTQRWRLTFSGFSPLQDTVTNDFNLEESVRSPWCDISMIMMKVWREDGASSVYMAVIPCCSAGAVLGWVDIRGLAQRHPYLSEYTLNKIYLKDTLAKKLYFF